MGRHKHSPPPSPQAERFIEWCAEHITEWPEEYISCARYFGTKNKWWKKNVAWRKHHSGLTTAWWAVCTKRQWLEARAALSGEST